MRERVGISRELLGLQKWFTYQNKQNCERKVMEMVASLYFLYINDDKLARKGVYKGYF